jgi:hypothetical protein
MGHFTKPSECLAESPAALDTFFVKAFALEPSARFESAERLAIALRAAVAPGDAAPSESELPGVIAGKHRTTPNARRRAALAVVLGAALFGLLALAINASSLPATSETSIGSSASRQPPGHASGAPPATALSASLELPTPVASVNRTLERRSSARRSKPNSRTPAALTREPVVATPGASSDRTDPLFGIPLKARLDVAARSGANLDAGLGAARHAQPGGEPD